MLAFATMFALLMFSIGIFCVFFVFFPSTFFTHLIVIKSHELTVFSRMSISSLRLMFRTFSKGWSSSKSVLFSAVSRLILLGSGKIVVWIRVV